MYDDVIYCADFAPSVFLWCWKLAENIVRELKHCLNLEGNSLFQD